VLFRHELSVRVIIAQLVQGGARGIAIVIIVFGRLDAMNRWWISSSLKRAPPSQNWALVSLFPSAGEVVAGKPENASVSPPGGVPCPKFSPSSRSGETSLPPFSQRSAAIEDALHRAGIHANLAADVAVCAPSARIDFIRAMTACSVAFGTSLPSARSQPNCLLPPL